MAKPKRLIRKQLNRYQRFAIPTAATMGDYSRVVEVPDRINYVYVRLSSDEVIQIFNNRVPPRLDTRVWIGYDPKEPHLLQVLSIRGGIGRYGGAGATNYGMGPHHLTHEWMANDGGNDV